MRRAMNGLFVALLLVLSVLSRATAQESKTIKLNEPNKKRGIPVMEALSVRASVREWSDKELNIQDLSDLLWAANGINRPDKRRTAASAINAQDVDIYVFMKDGVFIYDAANHALNPVLGGDHRSEIMMSPGANRSDGPPAAPPGAPPGAPGAAPVAAPAGGQPSPAPIQIILISDISRFRAGTQELKLEWAAIDTGIVSQNIALFCAATGLATRPRASISEEGLRTLLNLKSSQYPLLNHPVGYPK